MKQRLGIAQALINAPSLLMLDEPTSALDPIGRREVLEMVASLRGRTTVFFSTHILADVERVCVDVAILEQGRVVAVPASTSSPSVRPRTGWSWRWKVREPRRRWPARSRDVRGSSQSRPRTERCA
jgi:ABC-type multidrug transport system ATPase subunit